MAPPLAKRNKWLEELNEEHNVPLKYVSNTSNHVLCVFCEKNFLGSQKSQLVQHLSAEIHKANGKLKLKRKAHQATLGEVLQGKPKAPTEIMHQELCTAFLSAEIPLKKLRNSHLRNYLEKYTGKTIPSEETLRSKYLPLCYDEAMEAMKEELKQGSLWVSTDCSRDSMGREVANVVVGKLDCNQFQEPYLVKVSFLSFFLFSFTHFTFRVFSTFRFHFWRRPIAKSSPAWSTTR